MACCNAEPYIRVVPSASGIVNLDLCDLPACPLLLVRSSQIALLQERASDYVLTDQRLTKVSVIGPGRLTYTDSAALPGTYYYRLMNPCPARWIGCIVKTAGYASATLDSFKVLTACSSTIGYMNLTVTFGVVPTPLYSAQSYIIEIAALAALIVPVPTVDGESGSAVIIPQTLSVLVTATPNGNAAPIVTATVSGTLGFIPPTVYVSLNTSTGMITLSLANLNTNVMPYPSNVVFYQVAPNGAIIAGPLTVPLTIGTCPS